MLASGIKSIRVQHSPNPAVAIERATIFLAIDSGF